jgi:hypothetical protein
MQFNFQEIINALNENLPQSDNFAFRIARAMRTPDEYVLNQILPDEKRPDFHVTGAAMTITPTLLGQTAMDSPYPPMGNLSSSQFFENTTKFAGQMFFSEQQQRDLLVMINSMIATSAGMGATLSDIFGNMSIDPNTGRGDNGTVNGRRLNALLGLAAMMRQSHWDTREWARGEALTEGILDFTFGVIPLKVDYNIPAANIRTNTGTDTYDGTTSKWWADVRFVNKILDNPTFIMNSDTYRKIVFNDANQIEEIDISGGTRRLRRYRPADVVQKRDANETMSVTIYDKGGTVMKVNPKDKTLDLQALPFVKNGRVIVVGQQQQSQIELLYGAVNDVDSTLKLGYTHVAPTVEGMMMPGEWMRIYTPEQKPYQVMAETAVNFLPAILNPKKLIILKG